MQYADDDSGRVGNRVVVHCHPSTTVGKKLLRRQQLQRARDFVETPGGAVYLSDVQGPEVVSHSSPIVSGHEDRLQGHPA